MTHPFERYFAKHSHYPHLRIDNGVQRLTIEFAPGYVRIATSPPFAGEVYITRSAWLSLLKRAIPLTRQWRAHPDFDVPQAVHQAHLVEMAHLQDLRQTKKDRRS